MPQFNERKPTMELRIVAYKRWTGPAPFDFDIQHRLEQKWKLTRGGYGDGVKETEEWFPVPVVSEELAK